MSDTNKVNTLEDNEIQNTDTDLEKENIESDVNTNDVDSDSNTSTNNDKNDNIDETLDSLSDEEFIEFLNSGKVSKKEKSKEVKNNESDTLNTSSNTVSKDSNSIQSLPDDKRSKTDGGNTSTKEFKETSEGSETKGKESKQKSEIGDKSTSEKEQVDYKSTVESIFKPFKANGKQITPRNVEDVISLMQMGANYTQKMQTLQPIRKIAESVSKAGIKEDDLNFLIDLHNGEPEAIKILLKKHKVDPIDLDLDTTNYVPKNNIISDEDVEYSTVLEEVKDSLPKINDILTTKWDSKSKSMILKDPNLVRALHEEIELGRFDEVQARLESEKTFGRYKNVSDLEAYIDLVNKVVKEKQNQSDNTKKTTNTPKKDIPDKSKAAPNKTKHSSQRATVTPKDIFNMSEEEFSKLNIKDLI